MPCLSPDELTNKRIEFLGCLEMNGVAGGRYDSELGARQRNAHLARYRAELDVELACDQQDRQFKCRELIVQRVLGAGSGATQTARETGGIRAQALIALGAQDGRWEMLLAGE